MYRHNLLSYLAAAFNRAIGVGAVSAIMGFATLGAGQAFAATPDKPFQIFDALLFNNKPSSDDLKMTPTRVVYEAELWPSDSTTLALPDSSAVRRAASAASASGKLTIFDIERWPASAADTASIGNYSQVLRWIKQQAPALQFGFYALPPVTDYWRSQSSDSLAAWKSDNDTFRFVADDSAALFPSAYTFYEDRAAWVRFAAAQVTEARRLANGKPVYLFLWPAYHDSNTALAGQPLPADYWKLELDTARALADGVVLWGGYMQQWDENAPWWLVTKDFVRKQGSIPTAAAAAAPILNVPGAPGHVQIQ